MMTFNELVNRTHVSLAEKSKREVISLETIRKTLEEAGVAELMQKGAAVETAYRLIVRQVWIKGQKWRPEDGDLSPFGYRRTLQPGLNGWVGGNGTGKSTILKSIIWALTGVRPSFKPDVLSWLQDIAVEIEIVGDRIYTIRYFPHVGKPRVTGSVFALDLDSVLGGSVAQPVESFTGDHAMSQAISRFFCTRMGFSPLEWVKPKAYSVSLEHKTVSWEVYSQAMFVGADDYSDYLFPQRDVNGRHHQKTLGMYLGLDLLEAVSKLQLERDQMRQEYNFERHRVKANAARVAERIARLKEELRQVENRIECIDEEQSVLIDPTYVRQVREQVAACTDRVVALSTRQQEYLQEEQQAQIEFNRTERACQALRESIEFKLFLSGLEVERCPHCENPVSQARVEEELETGQCRVCGSHLRPISSIDDQKALLEVTEKKVGQLKTDLRRVRREIKKVDAELEEAHHDLQRHQVEFSDLSRQEREGFTSEMRGLLDRQGYLRGQLDELQEQTEESQAERLRDLRQRRDVLSTAYSQLQSGISARHKDIFEILEAQITDLATAFGVRNVEQVLFNKQLDMFVKQSGKTTRFQDMDIGEALRLKIAFHLTLLSLRVNEGLGRHPTFLIVDAPGGAEMDERHFSAILQGFADVRDQLGDRVQILVASTKEKLVDACSADRVECKLEGEPLF